MEHGIGCMLSEKVAKICSAVAKLMLLACLRTNLAPKEIKKSLSRLTEYYFVKITTDHFLSPSKCDRKQQHFRKSQRRLEVIAISAKVVNVAPPLMFKKKVNGSELFHLLEKC